MAYVSYTDGTASNVEYEEINFDELTSCYTYNPLFTAIKSQSKTVKDENNFFQWIFPNEVIKFEKSNYTGYLDMLWLYGSKPVYNQMEGTKVLTENEKISVITKMDLQKYRYVVDSFTTILTDDNIQYAFYSRDGQTYTELQQNEKIMGCLAHWENIENNKILNNIYPVIRYVDSNGAKMLFYPHAITTLSTILNTQSTGWLNLASVAQNADNIIYLMLNDINKSYNYPASGNQFTVSDENEIAYIWYSKGTGTTELHTAFSYNKFLEILALLGVYFRIGGIDYLGFMDISGQTTGEYLLENEWSKSAQYNSDTINNFTSHEPPYVAPPEDDIESVGYGYFSNSVMGTLYSLYNKLDLEKIAQWFYNQTEKIDIANNVISLKEIPFSLSTLNIVPLETDLKIGGVNVTYNNENIKVGQIVSPATISVSVLFGEFNIPRLSNTFLDYSPYTKYELLLPFAPTPVTLPDWCVNKTVQAIFLYDIYTTSCQYVIECNGERICSVSGCFGIDRPISAQNVALKDASRLSAQVATASSVLGGVMSSASGNIGGIVSGAISGVSALSQQIMSQKQNYMYTVGANGDSSSVGLCHAVHLKITRTLSAEDSNFTHVYGRPLCKYKKLSSVTGYTKCDNINTTGLTCSETEKQRIKQLLETGIYI